MSASVQNPQVQSQPFLPKLSSLEPEEELKIILQTLQQRLWQQRPDLWVEERLGAKIWSRQRQILQAVATHRKTAIKSCHAVGKSWVSAAIATWWEDVWPVGTAFVVTSAPSNPQIKAILWRYIGRFHSQAKLAGRVNQSEWYMTLPGGKEEIVGFGRKPNDFDPAAFQGIHARRVLVILDEANGIRGPLHDAADSLISNDESKIVMIGNPDDPSGEFYEACKPGSGWHVESISAFDSPNFTGEEIPKAIAAELVGKAYVEDKRRKWAANWYWNDEGTKCLCPEGQNPADTNPFWQSKVLGLFPEISEEMGLIPITWVKAAQDRSLSGSSPSELGVDVGGGGDSSTICHKQGPRFRIVNEDHNPDTMHTCGTVIHFLKEKRATVAKVDEIGIGRGVVDRGREQHKPFIGINVGESPIEDDDPALDPEGFINLRAQNWWRVRILFESGQIDIDPQDEDLASELCSIRYKRLSSGKIQIESKDEAKRRGVASPNRAEALMLAVSPEPVEMSPALTWGRQ